MSGARVASVATAVIAVICVVAAASLDVLVARRVLWEVDTSLSQRLAVVAASPAPLAAEGAPAAAGTDGAPVYAWWVSASGRVRTLTDGAPALPRAARSTAALPLSIAAGHANYRFDAISYRGGELVGAEDLASPLHIEKVLLLAELIMGPVLLVAVFLGVLVIAMRSVAPVEAARRRLLELTADASHELRTPLTVIEAEIELARSGPPDACADREALDHIARESRRLKSIVEDLLWLARFDAGTEDRRPSARAVDLSTVVARCAARFAAVAAGRRISLASTTEAAWIEATEAWVDRLAGTLIDNACRYAPGGGTVRVTARTEAGRAVLRVEDDGPGLPPDAELFDRFRRASEQPGGAGLGLAIADSVVRSTGGRWRVGRSDLGGALMEVSWRSAGAPAPAPVPEPAAVG